MADNDNGMKRARTSAFAGGLLDGEDAAAFGIGVAALAGAGAFLFTRFRVAKPHQFLVRTGLGVKSMQVKKTLMQWPLQQVQHVDMTPKNIQFVLPCLSKQYLPFDMPVTFTVSPWRPDGAGAFEPVRTEPDEDGVRHLTKERRQVSAEEIFCRYALTMDALPPQEYYDTILGVVHGETRVLAAQMEIDQINDDRDAFRETVVENVQDVLLQYGVRVGNANIAELIEKKRAGHMGYLEARERRKLSDAVQQSEIDVAEAKRMGDTGKMEKEAQTRQRVAVLQARGDRGPPSGHREYVLSSIPSN